jgi:hypothetical protein
VKVVAWLAGVATVLTAGFYMVVSLNRWEWNRALFFGLILLIAEVALATGLVLRKLGQLTQQGDRDPMVDEIVRATRPSAPDRFAWMRETNDRLGVFITFLVGGGVVLSAVAWLVDRIASSTTTPHREARLAAQLAPISYPSGGLLVDEVTALAVEVPGVGDDADLRRLLRGNRRR